MRKELEAELYMNKLYLSDVYIYPIKSLGGIRLEEVKMDSRGPQYDRRWMLIDEKGTFISQRTQAELALLQVSITDGNLEVSHKISTDLNISFPLESHIGTALPVRIWDDISVGLEVDKHVSEWFSDFLKHTVRLVQMPSDECRFVDSRFATNGEVVAFSDGYPSLIIGQASLDELNRQLEFPVLMDRFRPNFVFSGGEPHTEDRFGVFDIGGILFSAVKPCSRCVLTTIDQQTGVKGAEPMKTLAKYRRSDKKILFGQNLLHTGTGVIRVSDELKVLEWKESVL